MQTVTWAIVLAAVLGSRGGALAQTHPQDGIDRNLQAREAREHDFRVGLQDDAVPAPRPMVQGQTGLQIYVPIIAGVATPGTEILRRDVPRQPVPVPMPAPGKSVVSGDLQLQDSQSRRQMELQTQTNQRPDAERQQVLQIQQLGFDRETSSQDLSSRIMRDSSRALGTPR
jgi:hypothetical protein